MDRIDHADSKFVQPGATPGLPANFLVKNSRQSLCVGKDYLSIVEGEFHDSNEKELKEFKKLGINWYEVCHEDKELSNRYGE
ncbi:MAG: hypothetical protein AAGU27_02875 [Dehalobacterium sp.]